MRGSAVCDIADELAQETLVRGYVALPTLVDPKRFGSWLCGIALASASTGLNLPSVPKSRSDTCDASDQSPADSPTDAIEPRTKAGICWPKSNASAQAP